MKTINRLQNNVKHHKIEHAKFLKNNNLEFPPINNIVMTFPINSSPRTKAVHSIHTPSKKIKMELEQIFQTNNVQIDGNNVSKIILGGPLKSRMSLDATFRDSFILDKSLPAQCKYRSLSKSKLVSKKSQESINQTIDHIEENPERKPR